MKITKQNILQAIKEVKKEEKIKPHHHCDVCFVKHLLKMVFDKGEFTGCMKVLNGVNKTFGTTYYIYAPLCEYGDAVPYELLFKKLKRTVKI